MRYRSVRNKKYISDFPHGIMFHYFHDEKHPISGQGSITAGDFERILNYIGTGNILNPDEWIFKLKNSKLKAQDVCVTFDDGLRSQYDICLPILDKYNLRAFWFVYSSVCEGIPGRLAMYKCFINRCFKNIDDFYEIFFKECQKNRKKEICNARFEGYYKKIKNVFPIYSFNDIKFRFIRDKILKSFEFDEIMGSISRGMLVNLSCLSKGLWLTNLHLKALSRGGHFIGLHSYDHPTVLSRLSYYEQFRQYKRNYMHIKAVCKNKPISASHPCNSYNKTSLRILKKFGILCGFRSNMSPPNEKGINPTPLEIAREDHADILKRMC